MLTGISAAVLLLAVLAPTEAERPAPAPAHAFEGLWQVSKVVDVGGHAASTAELAKRQFGLRLRLTGSSILADAGLLWGPPPKCDDPVYELRRWVIGDGEALQRGSLLYYDQPEARPDEIVELVVNCAAGGPRRATYVFEVTKGDTLASYYDGFLIYLERVVENPEAPPSSRPPLGDVPPNPALQPTPQSRRG